MRWDKSRMNLHSWTEWGRKFILCVACWLCYRHLFQPHHKWALMFHTGFAAEESKFVCEHLVLTDCLFYPPSFQCEKPGTFHHLSFLFFVFCFFHILFLICFVTLWVYYDKDQLRHSFINQYWFCKATFFIYCKVFQPLAMAQCTLLQHWKYIYSM